MPFEGTEEYKPDIGRVPMAAAEPVRVPVQQLGIGSGHKCNLLLSNALECSVQVELVGWGKHLM
jgi:hypothetical protein